MTDGRQQRGATRRRFLAGAGAIAASASVGAFLPPSVRKVLADQATRPARVPRWSDIRHVVLLMQENRSFDHYFGTMSGVAGFDDADAVTLADGRSVFHQPDPTNPDGFVLPFHLDTRTTNAITIPSTGHGWEVQHAAWNGGAMDNWLPAHRACDAHNAPYVMGYYTREDIPFHYALADAFTICDRYHSSVLGPTWPNRMYWMTGTMDAAAKHGGPLTINRDPTRPLTWTTYPERLEKAGVSWKVYQGHHRFDCNVLPLFQSFMDAAPRSALHRRGLALSSHGQFEHDAIHDRLPAVSWIIPNLEQSEHPDFCYTDGAAFVASKIAAIAANPDVWAKTVFILDYDENDGLFDHVVPPTPPPGTPDEFVDGEPIGAGYRVPAIIVSPWTAGGWVASEPFDHTSVLRFLERFTGVAEPNISPWRRETFGDLTSTFRLSAAPRRAPALPDDWSHARRGTGRLPPPVTPPARQSVPRQERGHRPLV